ncbi:MAG: thiamine pyrophosphate-dependent enzyme [Bacteroidota bacterium]
MIDFPDIIQEANQTTSEDSAFINEVLRDYWICLISREASLLGRKEVLTGKAKFGILGDGKEVPQVALARAYKKGDHRSGYYRDQTLMFALGISTVEEFFAQLYADADNDPFSGGRQMNAHFATPTVDKNGSWVDTKNQYNTSSDISSTAGQMARGLGLALASKKYRNSKALHSGTPFSDNGNEVCFVTIGDASTSEGAFWETMNAAAVTKVPMAVSVWDDGYGISVPIDLQTTKKSITKAMEGFRYDENGDGIYMYEAKAWDYPALCEMYERGVKLVRDTHTPALFHVTEVTQPQGHSTSGSHERYKSKERLQWEIDRDGIKVMSQWIVENNIASKEKIDALKAEAKTYVKECKNRAWKAYQDSIAEERNHILKIYSELLEQKIGPTSSIKTLETELKQVVNPTLDEVYQNAKRVFYLIMSTDAVQTEQIKTWLKSWKQTTDKRYHTNLYSDSVKSALKVPVVYAEYDEEPQVLNAYQILNQFFDKTLEQNPNVFAFGEDVGRIGDVNQGFAGLQQKYGKERVFDTGIREWTIMGQAIGMSMRGLRPIAEIQYLDYLIYGISPLSDDLATLRYRSNGIQTAPAIIRTRGHRLEGIWHAGSPMGMLINSLRGMYIITPRNMVQAVGFYNTMLQSDDPALIIECLNGYRLKESLPNNLTEFSLPLGVPEILNQGIDVTLVTYGSCVRIAQQAIKMLDEHDISVELIDVQTLLPFDLEHVIADSISKTNKVIFLDEDVPGGATAYMMQEVLEKQNAYQYLDAKPVTITAHAHRPPYGSEGDYFSKPNPEDIFEAVYKLMHEDNPEAFPQSFDF